MAYQRIRVWYFNAKATGKGARRYYPKNIGQETKSYNTSRIVGSAAIKR